MECVLIRIRGGEMVLFDEFMGQRVSNQGG